MFKIYIGTTLNPKQVIVAPDASIQDVYKVNNVELNGILTLNGDPLTEEALVKPLKELNIADGAFLTITKKYASA